MLEKWAQAFDLFEQAVRELRKNEQDKLIFAAASKAFQVSFEYSWKLFKRAADGAGLEVYSPRDAVKAAAQLKLIADLELWQQFLNARNLSVHDYIGMGDEAFVQLMYQFRDELKRLKAAFKERF